MVDIGRRKLNRKEIEHGLHNPDNFDAPTHIAFDKETNEPILALRKSNYSNEYTGTLHPDFKNAHKGVLMPHELNPRSIARWGEKPSEIDRKARQLHNGAYRRYYEPHTRYEYSHTEEKEIDGEKHKLHHYKIFDRDKDHILTVAAKEGPESISTSTNVTPTLMPGIGDEQKYKGSIHWQPAKTKHSGSTLMNMMDRVNDMHTNKDRKEPRFIGHKTHGSASHSKSFKTKLPEGEAIPAYLEHIRQKHPGGITTSQSPNHAEYVHGETTHHLIHSNGLLHHTTLDSSRYSGHGKNTDIVEST